MAFVTDISELKARQDAVDQGHVDHAAEVTKSHPGHKPIYRHPTKAHRDGGATNTICLDCNEPEFRFRNKDTGIDEVLCRTCVNATRKLSLVHTGMTSYLCLRCEIDLDSFGIVNAANHRTEVPIEDYLAQDGITRRPGIKSLIGAGLVEVDDATDWTLLHLKVHNVNEHCANCKHVRHPECPGTGICEHMVTE